jgi:hypothetical protein
MERELLDIGSWLLNAPMKVLANLIFISTVVRKEGVAMPGNLGLN